MLPLVNEGIVSKPTDLVQGTLDLLILKIIALEPTHGWAISQRLSQISSDVLRVSEGSLYTALHKLEHEGWIAAEWKPSENNRRAKFYSLTRSGRRRLQMEAENWSRLSTAITFVVRFEKG
jgi:PadR family transcriptional regulator PadR